MQPLSLLGQREGTPGSWIPLVRILFSPPLPQRIPGEGRPSPTHECRTEVTEGCAGSDRAGGARVRAPRRASEPCRHLALGAASGLALQSPGGTSPAPLKPAARRSWVPGTRLPRVSLSIHAGHPCAPTGRENHGPRDTGPAFSVSVQTGKTDAHRPRARATGARRAVSPRIHVDPEPQDAPLFG